MAMPTNPFQQTWATGILGAGTGTLQASGETLIKPNINTDEEQNGNQLQQYYIYHNDFEKNVADINRNFPTITANAFTPTNFPLDQRLIGLTQIYTENIELLPYTNVFRNSDQGHDFYTDGRNVRGSFTYPTNPNSLELSDYSKFAANTTFGGGSTVCALLLMFDSTHEYLSTASRNGYPRLTAKQDLTSSQINGLINASNKKPLLRGTDHFNSTTDGIEYVVDVSHVYCLLPLSMKGYDTGMHKLTEFTEPYKLYAVTYSATGGRTPSYEGYVLYHSELVVPVISFDMIVFQTSLSKSINDKSSPQRSINSLLSANKTVTTISTIGKLRKLYETTFNDAQKNSVENEIYTFFKNSFGLVGSINRGVKYYFNNCKTTDDNIAFLLLVVMKNLYRELTYTVHPTFRSLLNEKNDIITAMLTSTPPSAGALSTEKYKFTAFTTDTNVGPTEQDIIKFYRDKSAVDLPYRFTVVSNAIDGSGQGGQIYPSYHPPDIDVYMNIFDMDNNYRGSIFRFTFLSNITSNSLNSKSSVFVELHYCFFSCDDFLPASGVQAVSFILGREIAAIKTIIDTTTKNILCNTRVERNADLLKLTTMTATKGLKIWVFNKIDNAPSVLDANQATVSKTFTNKVNKIKINMKFPTSSKTKQSLPTLASSLYSSLFSCICSKSIDIIEKFITAGLILYYDNEALFETIFTTATSNPEENFCKIFLLRNKFIGDKSRATDALFMNKNPIYECVQSSNDDNTLSTAFMFNLSSQLLAAGSTNKSFYFAPYLTVNNDPLLLAYPNAVPPSSAPAGAAAGGPVNAPSAVSSAAIISATTTITNMLQNIISTVLKNTKAAKSTTKKISKNAYNATIALAVPTKSRFGRALNRTSRGGRVPSSPMSKSPLAILEKPEYDQATETKILPYKKVTELEGQGEGLVEQSIVVEGPNKNAIIALQNILSNIIYICDKYLKPFPITVTSDNLFIYMLLDKIEYLLENTSTIPLTIDSFKIILQTYLESEEKTPHYNHYLTSRFKTVFDMFNEMYMLDLYGVSYCYTTTLFDDEVSDEQTIPTSSGQGLIVSNETIVENTGEEKPLSIPVPEEKIMPKKKDLFLNLESPTLNNDLYTAAGGNAKIVDRNIIQVGGAADIQILTIIHNYYTNNHDDVLYRITQFNEWFYNYNHNITPESVSASVAAGGGGGYEEEVGGTLWQKLMKTMQERGVNADKTKINEIITEMNEFVRSNIQISDMITDIKLFLDSVDPYTLFNNDDLDIKDQAISSYIALSFLLIKLCSDVRNYLTKLYQFYFRRIIGIVEDIDENSVLQGVEDASTIDYINLFKERCYSGSLFDFERLPDSNFLCPYKLNIVALLSQDNLVFVDAVYSSIVFEPNGIAQCGKIDIAQTHDDKRVPTMIPMSGYRVGRGSKSKVVSLEFLDVPMIIKKLLHASCRIDYFRPNNYEFRKPLTVKYKKSESESGDEVTIVSRRTKIYLQSMTSSILFLMKHNKNIISLNQEEGEGIETAAEAEAGESEATREEVTKSASGRALVKKGLQSEEVELLAGEEEETEQAEIVVYTICEQNYNYNNDFMEFLITQFFLNVRKGYSVDNYYSSDVSLYTYNDLSENKFSITIQTAKGPSMLQATYKDGGYNIRYNKQLLIQILFYFYDKCLYYLIMTTEQQENLFTNYIEQGNPENEEGDVSLLVDLSEMINQYFIDKNILQLLKPFLSNARIIEGSTISSAKLSDSLAPLIEGFEEEEELGGGSGKMSKKNIRKSYYKKQTIKRNKKKHTSRKHKKGKKSKKTRKQ